jgi:hypothetical protein
MADNLSSVRLFSATIPLNLVDTLLRLGLKRYNFYYLFTPAKQILRKKNGPDSTDHKQENSDFDFEISEIAYACGRIFDETGELAWISEEGTLYCSFCGTELPIELKNLADWVASDFRLTNSQDHQLLLWFPQKKAPTSQDNHLSKKPEERIWQDNHLPRRPDYGMKDIKLAPFLRLREWHSEDMKERYVQYVAIESQQNVKEFK